MDYFKTELKILAEDMVKLYEHTKIVTEKGKTLVDIKLNITEKEADTILVERIKDLLNKYQIKYKKEEIVSLVNEVKKDAARIINTYRKEKKIQEFDAKDIEL